MTEPSRSNRLDAAVEALMAHPDVPLPAVDAHLADLLRIAGDLRDLPSDAFKAQLRATLLAGAAAVPAQYGPPLRSLADIVARLRQLESAPPLAAYDIATALADLPELSTRFLTALNQCTVGVSRLSGRGHWERHPGGDELLHILSGEADVVIMTDDGPLRSPASAGTLVVCPQGVWHRIVPRSSLSLLFATPSDGTETSTASRPRTASATPHAVPPLATHDLAAALQGLPELVITADTTGAEADAAVRRLAAFGVCTLGVMRYAGLTPWERHPDGDELLHVLDGEVDVTVLADRGPTDVTLRAGSVFVCPRGLWHRQRPRPSVTMLFGTPSDTTQVSFADDPRGSA